MAEVIIYIFGVVSIIVDIFINIDIMCMVLKYVGVVNVENVIGVVFIVISVSMLSKIRNSG